MSRVAWLAPSPLWGDLSGGTDFRRPAVLRFATDTFMQDFQDALARRPATVRGFVARQETMILETPGGQKLTLKDGPGAVEIVDSNGNSIKLEASGITITASAKVTINASQVAVSAGMVTVDAGMSKFSGVVQADTVICNSIISASYTPGAGNIW